MLARSATAASCWPWAVSWRSITSSTISSRSDWRRCSDSTSDCRFSSSLGEDTWPASSRGAVPVDPGPHLLDVGLGLGLLPLQVPGPGLQRGQLIPQLAVTLLQRADLFVFGQGAPAVLEPGQLGVDLGELQQPALRLGRCFHVATLACLLRCVAPGCTGGQRRENAAPGQRLR